MSDETSSAERGTQPTRPRKEENGRPRSRANAKACRIGQHADVHFQEGGTHLPRSCRDTTDVANHDEEE